MLGGMEKVVCVPGEVVAVASGVNIGRELTRDAESVSLSLPSFRSKGIDVGFEMLPFGCRGKVLALWGPGNSDWLGERLTSGSLRRVCVVKDFLGCSAGAERFFFADAALDVARLMPPPGSWENMVCGTVSTHTLRPTPMMVD